MDIRMYYFLGLFKYLLLFFREDHKLLSPNVKNLMLYYKYPLFIYPHLLPTCTTSHYLKTLSIELPEEKYVQ